MRSLYCTTTYITVCGLCPASGERELGRLPISPAEIPKSVFICIETTKGNFAFQRKEDLKGGQRTPNTLHCTDRD